MARQLAEQLRPELEAAVKRTDSAPGEAYSPDAASVRPCAQLHTAFPPGVRAEAVWTAGGSSSAQTSLPEGPLP